MTDRAPNIIPLPKPKAPSLWLKTKHANIVRYGPSGVYFVRAKVGGKLLRKSLKTRSLEIALSLAGKEIESARKRTTRKTGAELTFKDLAALFTDTVNADRDLSKRMKDYRAETLIMLRKHYPEVDEKPIQSFTREDCEAIAAKLRPKYSAPRFNGCLGTIKQILDMAVERRQIAENPAARVKLARVVIRDKPVYTESQLKKLFAELKARKSHAYFLAKFLCYFSFRIGTAVRLTPAHVHRKKREFHIPGEMIKWGDPGAVYRVPIFPPMAKLLDELDARFGKDREKLLPIGTAKNVLYASCKALGLPRLTHHSFRHIFTTHAIMNGVDIPTVAKWRGDKDGGAMLLKTYHHLIDEHSAKMAKKVRF